jgi:hypothetical protein
MAQSNRANYPGRARNLSSAEIVRALTPTSRVENRAIPPYCGQ